MKDGNGSSRLDRIERAIENLAEQHRNLNEQHRNLTEHHRAAMAEFEVQRVNVESLHSSASELHAVAQEHTRAIEQLLAASRQDGEHIRALARIAEIHERRLTDLEGGEGQ